ncbi:MAG TPA: hypothetical protein VJY15_26645, partial [Candidatus Acidoferrum sp.]|nr:hypothetical protein [Candidatus Acidoferrum sp.]
GPGNRTAGLRSLRGRGKNPPEEEEHHGLRVGQMKVSKVGQIRLSNALRGYLDYPEKESDIAIHLWRHNLMHTSEMRPLIDTSDGVQYRWLFHYRLGAEHMRFRCGAADQTLNLGLFNLAEDLQSGLRKAIEKLPKLREVVKNWPSVTANLGKFLRK